MATTSTTTKSKFRLGHRQEPMADEQINQTFNKLQSAIHEIYGKKESQLSFEDLYRSAYNLVLQKRGGDLYDKVKQCMEEHLSDQRNKLKRTSDAVLLEALAETWKDHTRSLNIIKDVLMYLDKTWVPQQPSRISTYTTGNLIFREMIVQNNELYDRVLQLVLDRIDRHRKGELVDLSAIQTLYSMLLQLDDKGRTVDEYFEGPVLAATEKHYLQVSTETLAQSTAVLYLRFVESKLRDERKMAWTYFPNMETKLSRILQKELILKHAMQVIEMPNSGLIAMVQEQRTDDLRLLFQLLDDAHSPHLLECAKMFGDHIKKTGLSIIQAPMDSSPGATGASATGNTGEAETGAGTTGSAMSLSQIAVSVVVGLMEEKEKCDKIGKHSFRSDKLFQKAIKEGFESCMNQDVRCAQYLAIYCDELLTGKLSESKGSIDTVVERVIGLFRFLMDKDVFESYYKQHLSKRLLGQRSMSEDAERTVIAKLKSECGHQFTSKLEVMFKDMALSQDASNNFNESLVASGQPSPLDFKVSVLASGFWPSTVHYQDDASIILPQPMKSLKERFETFYFGAHTGRILTWNYALGSCEVKVTGFIESGTHEFTVSPLQCIAMMAFSNSKRKLTFRELLDATGIPREDLKRHMISMAVPKFQVFTKTGPKREFLDEDEYEFNVSFKSKMRKIKIPLVSMSSSNSLSSSGRAGEDTDIGAVPASVLEARNVMMDAAIVRIMKSRKRFEHNNLVAEVFKQVRFRPSPQDVKKRIEALIEREYIERDPVDLRFYSYVA